ncbi:two component transcriptional regulator, LuxR family [Mariniphaga anaerophila]|uniref:Two component transcriptional regulator, LuxR family n=1 Tax=Mariniphaga anaerophila TaxID=1484053 RepID=A0A1M5CYA3_9BACT|nr:response regulator transcription factor [Mariniphaga anaerophila]SHF59706.1 two component transcriptional regulator, LuxR family [Mariniphaga anaerophila]
MATTVLIADDHQLFREGLVNLISSAPDIEVIAEAKDGKEATERAKKINPEVVLIDIGMPVMNGIEATRIIKKDNPKIKVIAVSMHSDRQFVKGALEAGADGYLLKNCTYRQLIDAIQSVISGKKYLSDDITEMVIQGYLDPEDDTPEGQVDLSERELEVLKLYAEGKSTREISEKLFISVKTVGTHKQHIFEKLGLSSNADMVKYAIKEGLIQLH